LSTGSLALVYGVFGIAIAVRGQLMKR